MPSDVEKIKLYGESHAIEVANFVVNLGLAIDNADIRRFDERVDKLRELFPAIDSPDTFHISLGGPGAEQVKRPAPPPLKELIYFSNDGKPEWVGSFGDNRVLVSCRKYTKWEEVWPSAKSRLDSLLACIDPYKPVHSVDYSVTDTFSAQKSENALISPNIFRKNDFLASHIMNTKDPRWDFSQGWFGDPNAIDQVLVRVEARSGIQNDLVVASIGNLHSQRFGKSVSVGDLLHSEAGGQPKADLIFDNFHDKNKELLRTLLVDELLLRMRLLEK